MKVGDINIPVTISVDKKQLHQIMKDNIKKEDESDGQKE